MGCIDLSPRAAGLAVVALLGCTASPPGNQDGTGVDRRPAGEAGNDRRPPPADGAAEGAVGTIDIYVQGDLSEVAFTDGLSGQTPYDYQIALGRYHILRSAADPSPVLCFDHGKSPVAAHIEKDNLVGSCLTRTLPSGSYTHGRTKVDWARYSVDGVYHYLGQALPGKLTFFRAYSDVTVDNRSFKAGEGTIVFSGITTVEVPVVYPPMPSMPGVTFEVVNGELLMTFSYSKPLPIQQSSQQRHWARFHWKVFESFRWADAQEPGYTAGVWDVAPVLTETVGLYGVSSYYITSSVD
jgi:hypothetical protein